MAFLASFLASLSPLFAFCLALSSKKTPTVRHTVASALRAPIQICNSSIQPYTAGPDSRLARSSSSADVDVQCLCRLRPRCHRIETKTIARTQEICSSASRRICPTTRATPCQLSPFLSILSLPALPH